MKSNINKSVLRELELIENFLEHKFTIRSKSNHPINNSEIEFFLEESYLKFELNLKNKVCPENLTFKRLGFDEDFEVFTSVEKYKIPKDSVYSFKGKSFVDSEKILGKLGEIHTQKFPINVKSNYKVIYKIEQKSITTIFNGTSYNCDDVFYVLGLISINIQNVKYEIYRHNINDESYIIIENIDKTSFSNLKFDIDSIFKSLGLLTGNWYQNERFIFTNNGSLEKELFYESLDNSVITEKELINPSEFRTFMNNSFGNNYLLTSALFQEECFSRLVENTKLNKEVDRTLNLLLEGSIVESPIIRCSINFVALETIVGFIHKENKEFFKPIKNSCGLANIKKELLDSLKKNKNQVSIKDYEILEKKLNNINYPANKDVFMLAFEFFKIDLPKRLKNVLDSRNKFLHGKTPFKENLVKDKLPELNLYADRIHLLVSILILKSSGYKGHIKNRAAFNLLSYEYYSETKIEDDLGQNDNVYYKI